MNWLQIVFWVVTAVVGMIMLVLAFRSQKPISTLVSLALWGWGSLFGVSIFGRFIGVQLSINWFTIGTSGLLGLPGTIALVLAQTFF